MPGNNKDIQILCEKQKETIISLTVTAGKDRVKRMLAMQGHRVFIKENKSHSFILLVSNFRRA